LDDAYDAAHGLLETTSWNKRLLRRQAVVHARLSHFVEDGEEKLSLAVKSQKDFIPLHPQTN
jgi:hypothetical protein